jgi:hypothetical protein
MSRLYRRSLDGHAAAELAKEDGRRRAGAIDLPSKMKHDGTKSVRKSKQTRVHNSVMSKNLSVLAIFLQTS